MKSFAWKSPYQSEAYWNALSHENLEFTSVPQADGSSVYFDHSVPVPTAWEVSSNHDLVLPDDESVVYQLCDSLPSGSSDSYYTLALSSTDARFDNRYIRQVKKARSLFANPILRLAETDAQIETALAQFDNCPERRDGIPMSSFKRRITALTNASLLLSYVLYDQDEPLGVSFVLKTDTQANLRYYSAVRDKNAGHLLHFLSIEDLFSQQGIEVVDLSGISPYSDDQKMRGIDEFKHQIGGACVEFRRTEHNSNTTH